MALTDFYRCCSNCTHSRENPCKDILVCLQEGPVCHQDANCRKAKAERKNRVMYFMQDKPVIFIGTATCGLGAGAKEALQQVKNYLSENQIDADVIEVGCIGLCSEEPLLDVLIPGKNRISFSKVKKEKVKPVLDSVFNPANGLKSSIYQYRMEKREIYNGVPFLEEHPFFSKQKRRVLENCGSLNPYDIEQYIGLGGYRALLKVLTRHTSEEICELVEKSGLRGRGGGGFPTGKKWKFALANQSYQKYFICNADEGDPGAFMDRALIEGDPHRVLEGLIIGAFAIGASKAYVYIRAEYPLAIKRLKNAISQAEEYGLLGYNILDSGFNLDVIIKKGAGAFVCGEETALIHSIEGKRGMPRPRPPFPAEKGLFDKPTIINNVETLGNIPQIINNGPEWFSEVGTSNSKGTKVFALSGNVTRTGLVEVEMGVTINDIVNEIGGGIPYGRKIKAVQMGGPSGGCITSEQLGTEIDYESLLKIGAMMGSGGMVVMDETICMVDVAKFFMNFIQRESCGKCIPCREGTRQMLDILNNVTENKNEDGSYSALNRFKGIIALEDLAEVIKETSLCGLGQSAPNPVLSTLKNFRAEYEAHIYEKRCPAGVCQDLIQYRVEEQECKGCTLCIKKCPNQAILGAAKSPHYIVPDKCIKCGVCVDVCPFKAIHKVSLGS